MRAMIFAAGVGSRLKPFTDAHPKALVEVGAEPMLGMVLHKLRDAGVDEAVVNVHHFADQVKDYLVSKDFGMSIHISDESDCLLDTGGGLLKARQWLEDGGPFVVHNADILSTDSVAEMLNEHLDSQADVSLLVKRRESSRHLYFDQSSHRLLGWGDDRNGATRPDGFVPSADMAELSFGGVHVVDPLIFPLLDEYAKAVGKVFSIVPFYTQYANVLNIRAHYPQDASVWFDVGNPQTLARARTWYADVYKSNDKL